MISVILGGALAGAVVLGALVYLLWRESDLRPALSRWALIIMPYVLALIMSHADARYADLSRLTSVVWMTCAALLAWRWPVAAFRAVSVGTVALTALALLERAVTGARPGDSGLVGNPNITAGAIILWPTLAAWVGAGALESRGALLGLAAALIARLRIPVAWRVAGVALAGIALLGLLMARPGTVQARVDSYEDAIILWAHRPATGWGPGAWQYVSESGSIHADSAPLTTAAESGFAGLAGWLWLVVGLGALAVRGTHPVRYGLLAVLVHQLVDDTFIWPLTALGVGAVAGILMREEQSHVV